MPYRIWIDQDSVLYDLHGPWLRYHNDEYPNHVLTKEDHTGWDANKACVDAGCGADVYKYFDVPGLWLDGDPLPHSQRITHSWLRDLPVELGIITTAANPASMTYKMVWLEQYFPYIKDIFMCHRTHIKHFVRGDILIDDGLHNLKQWEGISVCFTQPWNTEGDVLRAGNWKEVNTIVRKALALLATGTKHKEAERILKEQQA